MDYYEESRGQKCPLFLYFRKKRGYAAQKNGRDFERETENRPLSPCLLEDCMKDLFKIYLFRHNILVSEAVEKSGNVFEIRCALARLFGIRITAGETLLQEEMISFAAAQLGQNVPEPFYRGFPESVRELLPEQLLYDQILHYVKTYGLGMLDEAGHSVMEEYIERSAFQEEIRVKDFVVLSKAEAEERLAGYAQDLLQSTRPLSADSFAFLAGYLKEHDFEVEDCASKNTAIRLLLELRDLKFVQFLTMSDVPKLVDELNFRSYGNQNVKKLNLKNQDRKFVTAVIDELFRTGSCDIRTCCEKKAVWNGLLHHIHYQPEDGMAKLFVSVMRLKENLSVNSDFERAMGARNIQRAVSALKEGKGSGAVLRSLVHILSRCQTEEEVRFVLDQIDTKNGIVLLQILFGYAFPEKDRGRRVFNFTRHNMLISHAETAEEQSRRKTVLSPEINSQLQTFLREKLEEVYAGRLGRVYIDPDMARIAVPIQESAASGGWGVLPRGSRIPLEKGKIIRAFTYWEKVDDIDLSVIGIREDGSQAEFSWRTMAGEQSDAITYSGDQTSGYHGGSEYFDLDIEKIKNTHPDLRYLVLCNNVYSGFPFSSCVCRAGYMMRERMSSGEVFEPRTVKTSFAINCDSTFAYLFAIDIESMELIWLNTSRKSAVIIAGESRLDFLQKYFGMTSVMNLQQLFAMMATEVVDSPENADVAVSDREMDPAALPEKAQIIRSTDVERIMALMN